MTSFAEQFSAAAGVAREAGAALPPDMVHVEGLPDGWGGRSRLSYPWDHDGATWPPPERLFVVKTGLDVGVADPDQIGEEAAAALEQFADTALGQGRVLVVTRRAHSQLPERMSHVSRGALYRPEGEPDRD